MNTKIKRVAKVLLMCIIAMSFSSCNGQKSGFSQKERVDILTKVKTNDEFMNCFLKCIKENNLYEPLIQYEDELVAKKELDGYDEKSLNNFFEKLIIDDNKNRCVSKEIFLKLTPFFSKFDYSEYEKSLRNGNTRRTKEYDLIEYLKNTGSPFPEWGAFEYALKDNELTTDKKYFYLLMAMPYKQCD